MDQKNDTQYLLLSMHILSFASNLEEAETYDLISLLDNAYRITAKTDNQGEPIWAKVYVTSHDPKIWIDTRSRTVRAAWRGFLIAAPLSYDICFRILALLDR